MLLLDQRGTHIKAIAATDRWFMVVDAGERGRNLGRGSPCRDEIGSLVARPYGLCGRTPADPACLPANRCTKLAVSGGSREL
jgi:hypothetical protein